MYRWPDMEPDEYMDENDDIYDDMEYDYQYPADMPYMYYEPAFYGMYPVFLGGVNPYMGYMHPANYVPQMSQGQYPYYEGYSMPYYRQELREEDIDENKLEEENEADTQEYLEEDVLPYEEDCDVKMRTVDMSDIRD